ncbi:ABC transporter permease subunit [Actinomadura fibrosa]|uniref:ABC transporter permease subunit n=1 Tax=Actinomadura fibrosa TaxID=111802 RepID=A0ABW2XPR0_9ACTN|nr:ABC transporter permease subunit [Actinomadura fibrosa]
MRDVVAAEWCKLRSIRSTFAVLSVAAGCAVLTWLIAFQAARAFDGLSPARRADLPLRPIQELGPWIAGLCLGILGVLAATSEYRSGTIRASLVAVPRRGRLVAAKAVVVAAVALAAGEAVTLAAVIGTRLAIGGQPFTDQTGSLCQDLPAFAVEGTSVAVFALLGLALGLLLRSAAGAITIMVFLWHIVPLLAFHLPAPWDARTGSVLPGALATQAAGLDADDSIYGDLLAPPVAAAAMAAYALLPLCLAALLFARRDA